MIGGLHSHSQLFNSYGYPENAKFDENDPRAEELPIAIDPNNEEVFIDEVCYFVYGKFKINFSSHNVC